MTVEPSYPARKAAGLIDVTAHTLRHTFASWATMSGMDPQALMTDGGWSDLKMVQRYSHLSPGHRRDAMERLVAWSRGRLSEGLDDSPANSPVLKISRAAG